MDTNAKILLVDDSSFMRKVLRDILEKNGFSNFDEAENGEEGLEKFKSFQPDLVLLDIVMPKVDGIGFLKEAGSDAKVIVISAIGQDAIINEAKENGAMGYIVKPFENEQVMGEVEKVLK